MLAHELSHALADQNFNLARFIRQGRKSDDGASARLAVMEGQATWLMSEFLARKTGQSLKNSPSLVAMMSNLSENGAGQYPVFESAPLYERVTLIFPYTKGMLFQNAVFERDGQEAFEEVFRKPPVSTQQILHPEKYFAGTKPTEPPVPDPHLRGYKGLVGGSLGEIEHSILLEQYAGKERAAEIVSALARVLVRAPGEQEGRPRRAALCRGMGQRRRGARSTSLPTARSWGRSGKPCR